MTMYFYSTRERPYGCFSNHSRHRFKLDGKTPRGFSFRRPLCACPQPLSRLHALPGHGEG